MSPADMLLEARRSRGMRLADVASSIMMSVAYVSDLERGRRRITPELAFGLAAVFSEDPAKWVESVLNHRIAKLGMRAVVTDLPGADTATLEWRVP